MKFDFYLALIGVIFLFVVYFFISHAYVIMRLTTVLGFMGFIALLAVLLVVVRKIL